MTNEIYIPNELSETLKSLPKDQKKTVFQTIDSLGEDVLKNSCAISTGGLPKSDLREARAGGLRVLFQYTPENHSIIITDVSSAAQENAMAAPA